jgi:hypothetical protein
MKTLTRLTLACSMSLAVGGVTAGAHHSAAAFDSQKEITINGTVKSYRFTNPHVQLIVTIKKDDGSMARPSTWMWKPARRRCSTALALPRTR